MRIVLVNHPHPEKSEETAKRVTELLRSCPVETECVAFEEAAFAVTNADVVIALGGDGTMIHVAKIAANANVPLLGINCGHLGFMAGMESDNLADLPRLISGEYTLDKRRMLNVTITKENGEVLEIAALNEVAVSRGIGTHTATFTLVDGERKLATYAADGILVATPTGSTAYSLSAGGPIVDPQVDCFVVTPICPNVLTARPIIIHADADLTLQLSPRHEQDNLYLSADGEPSIAITQNDKIRIRRHEKTADFIRFTPGAFYETLRTKMLDRT